MRLAFVPCMPTRHPKSPPPSVGPLTEVPTNVARRPSPQISYQAAVLDVLADRLTEAQLARAAMLAPEDLLAFAWGTTPMPRGRPVLPPVRRAREPAYPAPGAPNPYRRR